MWFDINQTSGELLLTESLDRESYSVINLMVTGSDQAVPPLSSIVSVQITVGDVNDNAPRFSQNVYTSSVPEFLATGASVTRVSGLASSEKCLQLIVRCRIYYCYYNIQGRRSPSG